MVSMEWKTIFLLENFMLGYATGHPFAITETGNLYIFTSIESIEKSFIAKSLFDKVFSPLTDSSVI